MDRVPVIDNPEHVERLRDALQFITDNPDLWDQSRFAASICDSAYCLYGHLIIRSGHHVQYVPGEGVSVVDAHGAFIGDVVVFGDQLLGLAPSQLTPEKYAWLTAIAEEREGAELWDGDNTLKDLWEYAEALTAGAIQPPEGFSDYSHPVFQHLYGRVR